MFQLDFQLKEEVGDTGTYVMNGEWALLGKYQPEALNYNRRKNGNLKYLS